MSNRREHLIRLYDLLDQVESRIGGKRILADCNGRMNWPSQGLYLFFENGELRSDSGNGLRVVRTGTHAVSKNSSTTLWKRLSQHKGVVKTGGGNHRGSIFRLNIGLALQERGLAPQITSWGIGNSANPQIYAAELETEKAVSHYLGQMPFLYINIPGESSKDNDRAYLEKNLIGLLSNYEKPGLDLPGMHWLGNASPKTQIRHSGLWSVRHTDEGYDPSFLNLLEDYIRTT